MTEILTSAEPKVHFLLSPQVSQPDKNRVNTAVSQFNIGFVDWTDVQSTLSNLRPDKTVFSHYLDKVYEIKADSGLEVSPDIVENAALGLWAISVTRIPDINFEEQMLQGSTGHKIQSELRARKPKLPELMEVMKRENVDLPNATVFWWARKS